MTSVPDVEADRRTEGCQRVPMSTPVKKRRWEKLPALKGGGRIGGRRRLSRMALTT